MKHGLSAKAKFILELTAFFVVLAMFIVNVAVKIRKQPQMEPYSYNESDAPRTVAHQTHAVSEWAEGFGPPADAETAASTDRTPTEPVPAPPAQSESASAVRTEPHPQEPSPEYTKAQLQSSMSVTVVRRPEEPLNINTATLAELMELDGIGETRGRAIIAYREEHGAFSSADELLNVRGIGEKTLEKLRAHITVG